MLAGIICALIAGACFAAGAGLIGAVGRRGLPLMAVLSAGSALAGLASLAGVDWTGLAAAPRLDGLAAWIVPAAALNILGHGLIAQAMAGGRPAIAWAIGQGGQAVPFIVAALVWREAAGPAAWTGLAVLLGGIAVLAAGRADGGRTARRGWTLLALGALACYGLNQTLMAVPSHWSGWHDQARLRLPLTLFAGALAAGALAGCAGWTRWRAVLPWALPYAAILLGAFTGLYLALDRLAAAGASGIAWPLACGTGVGLFAAWDRRRPGHAWRRRDLAGLILVLAGIALLAWRT